MMKQKEVIDLVIMVSKNNFSSSLASEGGKSVRVTMT